MLLELIEDDQDDDTGLAAPLTIILRSRDNVEIDLSLVLVDNRIAIFPHVEKSGLLGLSFVRDRVRLTAGAYIGLIPLSPGILVDVRPKMPIANLAHILDVAKHPVGYIPGVERTYQDTDIASDSVTDFLAINLMAAIKQIQAHGWLKDYVQRSEDTSYPRGRIDITGSITTCWSRGADHRVRSKAFEQTSDIAENRLIRHVLEVMLLSGRGSDGDQSVVVSANRLLYELPSSIGRLQPRDRAVCERAVARRSLPSTRSYYYRALEIALMILSERGISFEGLGEDVTLDTCIINVDVVFESYIRRVLQDLSGNSVVVRDGNLEGRRSLYDNHKNPRAQPDVVLYSTAHRSTVIGDVKYKDEPDRPDINQVVTYAVVYRAKRVVMIHQSPPGKPSGLYLKGRIDTIEVHGYGIDLDNADYAAEEAKMARAMFGLLEPAPEP